MRAAFLALTLIVAACRAALSAEAGGMPTEPVAYIVKLLADYGALGLMVVILLWDKVTERKRRDEDAKRWYNLDQQLISRMEANTVAMQEMAGALKELRGIIHQNDRALQGVSTMLATGSPRGRRATDQDDG